MEFFKLKSDQVYQASANFFVDKKFADYLNSAVFVHEQVACISGRFLKQPIKK